MAIAKKENHVDGDKIRAILFTRYLSQANKIQKRKMCSKIQEETKEEILAEKNNLDQNTELEDGGTQQQLSRKLIKIMQTFILHSCQVLVIAKLVKDLICIQNFNLQTQNPRCLISKSFTNLWRTFQMILVILKDIKRVH